MHLLQMSSRWPLGRVMECGRLGNGLGLRVQDFRLALEFSMDAPKGPQYYSAWICVAAIYPSKYLSIHTHIYIYRYIHTHMHYFAHA